METYKVVAASISHLPLDLRSLILLSRQRSKKR